MILLVGYLLIVSEDHWLVVVNGVRLHTNSVNLIVGKLFTSHICLGEKGGRSGKDYILY